MYNQIVKPSAWIPKEKDRDQEASKRIFPLFTSKIAPRNITAEIAKNIFMKSDNNLSLLLLDKEKIILEIYKEGLSEKNKFFSYSMSKSLTSYTVGYALCNGYINNLNDKAKNYSDLLKDNGVYLDLYNQQFAV